MNHLKLPGQLIGQIRPKCQERVVSFKKIVSLLNDNELHKPKFQIDLDEDKIDEMCKSYKKNPDYLIFKNKIILGVIVNKFSESEINYKMYVIDGQHRLEMVKKLNDEDINDSLTFCYYETNTDKEMKQLFIEINKDSQKNSKYVALDDFKQSIYDEFKMYLYKEKSLYFYPKKKEASKLFSISEILEKIIEKKYMDNFKSLDEIIEDLENKNKNFYKKIDYKEYLIEDSSSFYTEEKTAIDNGYIVGLKNNNFLEFLFNKDEIPDHKFKKQKDKISPKLRILVWTFWYKEKLNGKCPLCTETIKIGRNGFHCGHIISEANGGETILENLRPLCSTCNTKMSSMNWNEYEKSLIKNKKKILTNFS